MEYVFNVLEVLILIAVVGILSALAAVFIAFAREVWSGH